MLLTESRRAGRLVADMLDLSRVDAGAGLELADTDLVAITEAERERVAVLSPDISVTRTGETTVPIHADRSRVTQIVPNLVDNARRHTPAGGNIEIDVRRSLSPRCYAVLTVTDSGPGIPDADRERIFDRLVRLDNSRDRDHGGAGLGLTRHKRCRTGLFKNYHQAHGPTDGALILRKGTNTTETNMRLYR